MFDDLIWLIYRVTMALIPSCPLLAAALWLTGLPFAALVAMWGFVAALITFIALTVWAVTK